MSSDEIQSIQYKKTEKDAVVNAWWTKGDDAYKHAWMKAKNIRYNQSARRADFLRFARLYTNTDFDQFINGITAGFLGRRLSFNVVRSNIDTACAKISKSKTRPLILTNNGSYKQQNRAKKLTQYLDGMFDETKIYRHSRKGFRDSCIFGIGLNKIFKEDNKVKVERVFPDELIVDDLDARGNSPRELHQIKLVPREVLLDMFSDKPKAVAAIETAQIYTEGKSSKTETDMVGVMESWHLPSSKDATDGMHIISLEEFSLLNEPWKKDYFPFVKQYWNEPLIGFYGEGIAAQLVGIQLEINTVLQRIKESQELVAIPRVLVEDGSGVNTSHITDEIGGILRYRGTKPDFITPTGLNQEAYNYLEYLRNQSFQESGISQLSANSQKPAGLDSRVALREYQDIETERFALVAENYQNFHIDAARMMIDLQREIAEESPNSFVKVKARGFIETIKWSDVDMDDDKFVMSIYPTNFLPRTPEGQLEYTQELVQSGFVDQDEAMSLLNFPDLEGFFSAKTASRDDINMIIEGIIERGDYIAPEPYMDLMKAVTITQSAYLRGKTTDVPDDRLELLLRFIDAAQDLITQSTTPPNTPVTTGDPNAPIPGTNPGGMSPGTGIPPLPTNSVGLPLPGASPGAIARPVLRPRSDLVPLAR